MKSRAVFVALETQWAKALTDCKLRLLPPQGRGKAVQSLSLAMAGAGLEMRDDRNS